MEMYGSSLLNPAYRDLRRRWRYDVRHSPVQFTEDPKTSCLELHGWLYTLGGQIGIVTSHLTKYTLVCPIDRLKPVSVVVTSFIELQRYLWTTVGGAK